MEFKLPELGENIKGGDVVRVVVKAGDTVKKDQTILELETDKAVVEVPAPEAGTITELKVKAGDKAKVGQVLFLYNPGSGIREPGAVEKRPEPVKESSHIPVPPSSVSSSISPKVDVKKTPVTVPEPRPPVPDSLTDAVLAPPSVRKLAREIGVPLDRVKGTGPSGRITADDVQHYSQKKNIVEDHNLSSEVKELPDFSKYGAVERVPMSKVRRVTAKNLSYSWQTIPHVTQFDTADITEVLALRKKFEGRVEKKGGKLTMTAIMLKLVASALKVFPQFNASLDMETEEIVYKKYIHVGVAVDTDRGLLVPNIRNVDEKNILELSVELTQMALRARDHKTSLDELRGASFTISNLGGLGTTHFTPIVNWPEVAILGLGRAIETPVLIDGEWMPRMILPLSLSYDHRIIDGADAARFLRWIAEAATEPFLMGLEG
ncbi:2-oxo acid dehydrogenase subunit E2 [bacterium]|nr:2-oxo acid dehydrogenase subunit E2 [bacterium]